ncbi:MAG: C39 family peptidase [Candidatus Eremiobacteraeota bacterium]|nr:C39 family peptidase [Candidatus Eremiobacteraeota bacterium]
MPTIGTRGCGRFNLPVSIKNDPAGGKLFCEPTREAVLSWNTLAPEGELFVRILRAHQPDSEWLPHAKWSRTGRHSFSAKDHDVVIETDVVTSSQPFDGIEVAAQDVDFRLLALATPVHNTPSAAYAKPGIKLDVPPRTQYVEQERGWCSPAALSMLNAFHGHDFDVAATARGVFDFAYNGTGNWAFNIAFSGSLGLCAVVAYLRNLDHAASFLARGIPLALSYSWSGDELPGAPLEHSDGHLVALCGFTDSGDCVINDPAAPGVAVVYPRAAIEKIWLRNKGIAYVVAPAVSRDLEALINA